MRALRDSPSPTDSKALQGFSLMPADGWILGIPSHLGILSPIPCRMTGVTLPSHSGHPTRDRG